VRRDVREVILKTEIEENFLPLVTSFVEKGAECFGLGDEEALVLTLAAEEVFTHLCRVATPSGGALQIRCNRGGYFVEVIFTFPSEALDLRAFNLTATVTTEDEDALESMGLVIASRFVDRFKLSRERGGGLSLSLIKEKSYPVHDDVDSTAVHSIKDFTLRPPTHEEVKFIARLARSFYPGYYLPDFFLQPGKLVDMIAAGEYRASAAVGPAGEIGGILLWHRIGTKMVECFGPYVFGADGADGLPEMLLESCIGSIARTQTVGLINTRPTPELPRHHFERLGTLTIRSEDGSTTPVDAWFRLMQEDAGSAVWIHNELIDYLETEYRRLVLPREVRPTGLAGETQPPHSVLATEFDRLQGRVILRPMWPGADAEENIAQHVKLLRDESILNILFAMDLGQAWQAGLAPGLLHQQFEPCCLLPYAGEGDVVLFEYRGVLS
jgi:hypothetical protein